MTLECGADSGRNELRFFFVSNATCSTHRRSPPSALLSVCVYSTIEFILLLLLPSYIKEEEEEDKYKEEELLLVKSLLVHLVCGGGGGGLSYGSNSLL